MRRKQHPARRKGTFSPADRSFVKLLEEQGQQIEALGKTVKTELANATRQLEAYANLVQLLQGHSAMPPLHGWPVSPDLAVLLLQQLASRHYDLVLEFGSGSSTVLLAQQIRQLSHADAALPRAGQLAFEHLEAFHAQTLAQLNERGLAEMVTLHCKPLVPYAAADGTAYPFYDCEPVLFAAALAIGKSTPSVFVLVDGPPSATGRHARYPALPLLLTAFPTAQLDIWLDDYIRTDEQEIAQQWEAELRQAGRNFKSKVHRLEKDAFHLRIESLQENVDATA